MDMTRIQTLRIALLLFVFGPFINSCKKAESDCVSYGCITTPHYYLFWVNQDFECDNIIVTMNDADGNDYLSADRTIEVFDAVATDCSIRMNAASHAVYRLAIGKNYTYKATCREKSGEEASVSIVNKEVVLLYC